MAITSFNFQHLTHTERGREVVQFLDEFEVMSSHHDLVR